MRNSSFFLFLLFVCFACNKDKGTETPPPSTGILQLASVSVGSNELSFIDPNEGLPLTAPIVIRFSSAVNKNSVDASVRLLDEMDNEIPFTTAFLDADRTISLQAESSLTNKTTYQILINEQIKGANNESFPGISILFTTLNPPLTILNMSIDGIEVNSNQRISDIGFSPSIQISFSEAVQASDLNSLVRVELGSLTYNFDTQQLNDSTFIFSVSDQLDYYRKHRFIIQAALGDRLEKEFEGLRLEFYTKLDPSPKFPALSEEALLSKVQQNTFKYFWDFGHPVSGLTRERNSSPELVTSGGSGFGLMSIIVGVERGFISRSEGIARFDKIVNFLKNADRFHGVWPHWMNGTTGQVIPFSTKDNGGDLVETAFLAMGLLSVRQYLNPADSAEKNIIDQINILWESIEWDWHRQGDQNVLYWHWSPNFAWEQNLKISGYNEALITYILAAASPTHSIPASVYHEGWAKNGAMQNGREFYDTPLPLGPNLGGPLFFEHYTFLGIDPRNLKDSYADYWQQCVNHTQINRAYCIDNPRDYIGYSSACWGLTASDSHGGYSAHSPSNDLGVITPTAALSSFPYSPTASMDALEHFYYTLGDRIWKEYGFVDAFNFTEQWVADSHLAIDQGPIIIMIENHRTALLWNLFMSAPEVQSGLDKLGFTY